MWIYWILFIWPAIGALTNARASSVMGRTSFWALAVVLALVIGLRFQVGPDWDLYLTHLESLSASTWINAVINVNGDPAYWLLNWLANVTGCGIWLVNVVSAAIYVYGMFVLAKETASPWLAVTVAMPFMGIVIGMNYTRQAAAMGFIFLAVVALGNSKVLRFACLVVAAAMFHKTAAIILPLGVLVVSKNMRNRYAAWIKYAGNGAVIAIVCLLIYYLFLADSSTAFIENYLTGQMVSGGTVVRVLMNSLAAACMVLVRRNHWISLEKRKFWSRYAWSTLPFLVAIIVLPPLTMIDRLAFYWMPLQVYVFGQLPGALQRSGLKNIAKTAITMSYATVLLVWLNYGNFSFAWKPYRFYPVEVLIYGSVP